MGSNRKAALIFFSTAASAFASGSVMGVRASMKPASYQVPLGQPVWVRFCVENLGPEPVTLTVPGTEPDIPSPEAGLPISHVFSGGTLPALSVASDSGRRSNEPTGYKTPARAPILLLGTNGMVGTTIDLRDFFPVLRGAGQFRLTWSPYGGTVPGETVVINIAPLKHAEIVTDEGVLTVRMFYDDAPMAVANFLDLAKNGFYSGKTFHRVAPGYMIQGGCPTGDGTGIRLDGKRVAAEFNSLRHQKGTLSMALLDDDPDSASCQFFICNTEQRDWDGRYTVFATLVGDESFATLDRLMAIPVDETGRPSRPIYMRTVRVVDSPSDFGNYSP